MAAVDLSALTLAPWTYTLSLTTSWQEVQIPAWADVDIVPEVAVYLGFPQAGALATPETPADAGAVGTHRIAVASGTIVGDFWPEPQTHSSAQPQPLPKKLYLAAQSGTGSCTVVVKRRQTVA